MIYTLNCQNFHDPHPPLWDLANTFEKVMFCYSCRVYDIEHLYKIDVIHFNRYILLKEFIANEV
jgi:hypothetical protein